MSSVNLSEMESRMSEQNPAQPTPAEPKPGDATAQQAKPGEPGKQPPWGKPENFDAEQAWELIQNLRREKPDAELRQQLTALQQQQEQQRAAVAAALGVKPEEVSDTDRLASQVQTLQQQILSSERRALAAEHKVPETLLTGSDAESMRAQAQALVEFAQAAHVAAATQQPPQFQPNPGQGQGNAPLSPEAQAEAEYETYYPSASA